MKKILSYALLGATIALACMTTVVMAATETTTANVVSFGWGDFITAILNGWLLPVVATALFGLLVGILPAPVKAFLNQQRLAQAEQLFERGLGYAASQLEGQIKGQTISVDVKNQLVAMAVRYVLENGSSALIKWMGGNPQLPVTDNKTLQNKAVARLLTSPAVNAAKNGSVQVGAGTNPVS